MHGVVALIGQHFGDSDFFGGQPFASKFWMTFFTFGVVVSLGQSAVGFFSQFITYHRDHAAEAGWGGCEFEAGSSGVAPGHDHSARGRAATVPCVGLGKHGAFGCQCVNTGCRHCTASDAAAKGGYVVDAQIICQYENNIGRAFVCRLWAAVRSALPVDGDVGADL